MKELNKYLIIIGLILLGIATPVSAATYYASASGSDSNPGTQISPWKNCPGMKPWTGSGTLRAGDTVYFKNTDSWTYTVPSYTAFFEPAGGVTYDGRTWGTPGSLATINVASSGSGGTGVTFYHDDATYQTVFDGFKIVATGTATAIALDYSDSAKTTDLTGKEKIIKNLIVDGAGQTSGDTYCVLAGLYGGHTINNVYIQNNTVRNCLRDGIYIYTGNEALDNRISNITIRNNDVYGNGRASTSSGSGIKFKNRVIGAIAEYNYVHDNIGGGIAFDSGPYTHAGPEDITIRHNLIVNNTYTADKWSAAIAFSSDYSSGMTCSAKIYDNIIWNPALTRGIYMTAYQAANDCDVDINNNVIRAKGPAIYANSYLATMRINNNILISNDSDLHVVVYDTATSITNHTANIYYRMDGSSSLVTRKGTTFTTSTLGTWEPTAYSSNPNFKNAANLPTGFLPDNTPNTDGVSILSGIAINNGTILGYPFNLSINNVIRNATWDIGAYQQ